MGNQTLIKGAGIAAPQFLDVGAAAKAGAQPMAGIYKARQLERRQQENAQKAKVGTYLSNMPSGIELSKIPPAQQAGVAAWSKDMKFRYAEAARNISTMDVGSEEYVEAMGQMDSIKSAFVNLDNNLETFKANKTEYLKSSSGGSLSKGNDTNQGNLIAGIYTDESNMIFDENGNMGFEQDGGTVSLNDIPDYFNKDFGNADALININSDIYNSGSKLDPTMQNMYRQKILNMVRKGGRETALSLATDDLIQEGGLGIVDEDLLYNPERQEDLENAVVDGYMNVLNSSAEAGFKKKSDAAAKAAAKAGNKNDNYQFGKATEDDLRAYSDQTAEATNQIISSLGSIKNQKDDPNLNARDNSLAKIDSQLGSINETMKEINTGFIDLKYAGNGVYYQDGLTKKGPDGEEYSVDIDISTNKKLVDFIVSNAGLSEKDAIAVLKTRINRMLEQNKKPGEPVKKVSKNSVFL